MKINLDESELKLAYDIIKEREDILKEKTKSTYPFVGDFADKLLYMVTPLREKIEKYLNKFDIEITD